MTEVCPSLKMEWSEVEQVTLIDMYRAFRFYRTPKIKIITKEIINWMCWWNLKKISTLVYVCPMFTSTMDCRICLPKINDVTQHIHGMVMCTGLYTKLPM